MQLATTNQGFAPTTLDEAMRFSEMLSKSQMVPKAYQGKPEDVLVAVQWGKELGLAPLQALQNIACINGKPSVYGDAAMALVQASSVCEGIDEHFEGEGTPNPIAVCVAHRRNRTPVTARFSVEDAKRAGLWNKPGPWQAYPKRMMQMRARSFALRDAFPDVLKGLITAEEAQDYPQEKDATPQIQAPKSVQKNPLDAIAPPAAPAEPEPVEADPQQEYVEVEEVNQQLQEAAAEQVGEGLDTEQIKAQFEAAGVEVVDVPTMSGFLLKVPGKDEPVSVHQGLEEWSEAYEALADKTAKAGKVPARDRMTKLKALKEANELVLRRLDTIASVKHTASYSKRLAALGAASKDVAQAQ
jgi:hypothetical protein